MSLRRPTVDDIDWIEAHLRAHLISSMFQLVNLREHGLNSDAPRGLNIWIDPERKAFFAFTNEGMAMPQWPGASDRDWVNAVQLIDRPLIGAAGETGQIRALLTASGLAPVPKRMDADEESFSLELSDLETQPPKSHTLRKPGPKDLAVLTVWRAAYHVEVLGTPADLAQEAAASDVKANLQRGSFRILSVDGKDVSMTGFNATLADVVQIGGVFTPPDLRGRGYARSAVALHLAEARENGVATALLFASNPAAIRAYRSVGFENVGRYSLVIFDGPQSVRVPSAGFG